MKTTWSAIISIALLSFALAGPALAWDEAKLKGEVRDLLAQASEGFMKKDVAAVLATAGPGATVKYRDGRTLTMDQWAQGVRREMADWQEVSTKFTVEQVWPKGQDQAGAVYREEHSFTRQNDPGHKYAIVGRYRARLTKTPAGWRFSEFTDLGTRFLRDGQPYTPPAPPAEKAKPAPSQS
ncbi:MAG: nuclear transport factor 2 family protein [Deltaproteobacteria bacterium]|nr:nuclear transport factor 2 family protein [Deltaproteobacteria bacterium]